MGSGVLLLMRLFANSEGYHYILLNQCLLNNNNLKLNCNNINYIYHIDDIFMSMTIII